jgi:hypothetical protein
MPVSGRNGVQFTRQLSIFRFTPPRHPRSGERTLQHLEHAGCSGVSVRREPSCAELRPFYHYGISRVCETSQGLLCRQLASHKTVFVPNKHHNHDIERGEYDQPGSMCVRKSVKLIEDEKPEDD